MRISVYGSKELQAAILRMKGLDRELAKQIRSASKKVIDPIWREAVRGNVQTRFETRVLSDTARVTVSDQNVMLKSAAIGKRLSGGMMPSEAYSHAELGADRSYKRNYRAMNSWGTWYTVKDRHTRRQFRPRNLKGYVVYPAAARIIPRIASLWVATTVRTFHELIEGD